MYNNQLSYVRISLPPHAIEQRSAALSVKSLMASLDSASTSSIEILLLHVCKALNARSTQEGSRSFVRTRLTALKFWYMITTLQGGEGNVDLCGGTSTDLRAAWAQGRADIRRDSWEAIVVYIKVNGIYARTPG